MKKLTLMLALGLALTFSLPALSATADAGDLTATEHISAEAELVSPAAPLTDIGGTVLDDAVPMAGGGGCYYTCDCAGTPLKCCPSLGGGFACKVTSEWNCPQVYNC